MYYLKLNGRKVTAIRWSADRQTGSMQLEVVSAARSKPIMFESIEVCYALLSAMSLSGSEALHYSIEYAEY